MGNCFNKRLNSCMEFGDRGDGWGCRKKVSEGMMDRLFRMLKQILSFWVFLRSDQGKSFREVRICVWSESHFWEITRHPNWTACELSGVGPTQQSSNPVLGEWSSDRFGDVVCSGHGGDCDEFDQVDVSLFYIDCWCGPPRWHFARLIRLGRWGCCLGRCCVHQF